MEFFFGMMAGLFLWPWWGLGIFFLMCLVDAVLVEYDNVVPGTIMMIIGTAILVWLAGDANPFALVWNNFGNILAFLFLYFVVGALWSVIKWWLHLLKVKDRMKRHKLTTRPQESYARNNKMRIYGWICHWPFSMIGSVFADGLYEIGRRIYRGMSGIYVKMEKRMFADMPSGE